MQMRQAYGSGNVKLGVCRNTDRRTNCAHFVLKPTSFQPTQAYSSQSSGILRTFAPVGLSEFQ